MQVYYNGCFFTENPSQTLSGIKCNPLKNSRNMCAARSVLRHGGSLQRRAVPCALQAPCSLCHLGSLAAFEWWPSKLCLRFPPGPTPPLRIPNKKTIWSQKTCTQRHVVTSKETPLSGRFAGRASSKLLPWDRSGGHFPTMIWWSTAPQIKWGYIHVVFLRTLLENPGLSELL